MHGTEQLPHYLNDTSKDYQLTRYQKSTSLFITKFKTIFENKVQPCFSQEPAHHYPEHLCKQNCYHWVNREASVSPG